MSGTVVLKLSLRDTFQQWAEYGARLLSDFLFPDVVSQTFIISGLGFEATDWLVASLLSDAAVKV